VTVTALVAAVPAAGEGFESAIFSEAIPGAGAAVGFDMGAAGDPPDEHAVRNSLTASAATLTNAPSRTRTKRKAATIYH
jgi:hypothetical protein